MSRETASQPSSRSGSTREWNNYRGMKFATKKSLRLRERAWKTRIAEQSKYRAMEHGLFDTNFCIRVQA